MMEIFLLALAGLFMFWASHLVAASFLVASTKNVVIIQRVLSFILLIAAAFMIGN